jgi:ribosomal protein S18 acetylase RimI-like enzyme
MLLRQLSNYYADVIAEAESGHMEDRFTITEGNDRLTLQYDKGNFRALVWSSEQQGNWECRAIITQADFQRTGQRSRWISGLHSFDPANGRAVIKVGEEVPIGRDCKWAAYSWREWELVGNCEVRWLGIGETPSQDKRDSLGADIEGAVLIDCRSADWDGMLVNALSERRPVRLANLHSSYENYLKQYADTLSMEFVAHFSENRGEFNPRINSTAFRLSGSREEVREIAGLAREIWEEYYVPIIGRQQVDYMLQNFQSEKAIKEQLGKGYEYYLGSRDGQSGGYLAIVPDKDAPKLMISKLYVKKALRGSGMGQEMLQFVESLAISRGIKTLWLTVNKNNVQSIAWYSRMGFKNAGPIAMDIGGGFVMDDYRMEKAVG